LLREAEGLEGFYKKTNYYDEDAFWNAVDNAKAKASELAGGSRAATWKHDPKGGDCPQLVRPLAHVSDRTLNGAQRAAVEATGDGLRVARRRHRQRRVLVERFVRAVCDRGLDVDSILVITYTAARRATAHAYPAPTSPSADGPTSPASSTSLDLDDPRLLPPAAEGVSVRGGPRPALP